MRAITRPFDIASAKSVHQGPPATRLHRLLCLTNVSPLQVVSVSLQSYVVAVLPRDAANVGNRWLTTLNATDFNVSYGRGRDRPHHHDAALSAAETGFQQLFALRQLTIPRL